MFYGKTCSEKFLTVAGEKARCNYCFIATFLQCRILLINEDNEQYCSTKEVLEVTMLF